MSRKQSIYRVIFRLISTLAFIVLAGFSILKLTGSQLNLKAGKIQPTGIVRTYSLPKAATVSIKGQDYFQTSTTPSAFYNLRPGWYEVSISKEQYQAWSKTVNVEAGQAVVLDDIVLILQNLVEVEFKTEQAGDLSALYDSNDYPPLDVKNEIEIRSQDKLVTRLSQPVSLVKWYPDERHITYVSEGALWLIDLDGGGIQKICDFKAKDYLIIENGRSVLIQDQNGPIKKYLLRQ